MTITTTEYLGSYCDFPPEFDASSVFAEWSVDGAYDPSSSKDVGLKNPSLKYLHRFLALTFFGRQFSSATLNKTELFFLWCMVHKRKVNIGCWLASQFPNVLSFHCPLILGPLVTLLALRANLLDFVHYPLTVSFEMTPLDVQSLSMMGLVEQFDGAWRFA